MSWSHDWDGSLPPRFLDLLPQFWADHRSWGPIFGVPGLVQPVGELGLEQGLRVAFPELVHPEAVKAALTMIRRQVADDLAQPRESPLLRRNAENWSRRQGHAF